MPVVVGALAGPSAAAAAARFFFFFEVADLAFRAGLAGAGGLLCFTCGSSAGAAGAAGRSSVSGSAGLSGRVGRRSAAPAACSTSFPIVGAAPLRCSAPLLCSAAPSKESKSSGCAEPLHSIMDDRHFGPCWAAAAPMSVGRFTRSPISGTSSSAGCAITPTCSMISGRQLAGAPMSQVAQDPEHYLGPWLST